MSESYLEIHLDQQPIELCKLLKIADLVAGGGEAKVVISEGYVLLNGEVEYQKRKKVYHNDIVEFNGEVIQVIINENLTDDDANSSFENSNKDIAHQVSNAQEFSANTNSKQPQNKTLNTNDNTKKAVPTNASTAKSSKRKPISF